MRLLICLVLLSVVCYPQEGLSTLFLKMDSYLPLIEKDGFSGSVLLEVNDLVVLEKGYGTSCHRNRITPDMVFDLGSIIKIITATAILRLVMDGKIAFKDTLGKFIVNYHLIKAGSLFNYYLPILLVCRIHLVKMKHG